MHKAIIGVGSNINPAIQIGRARQIFRNTFTLIAESAFTQTKPVGYVDQPDFINGVFLVETEKTLDEMRIECKTIETRLGRVRTDNTCGPRTIDLDIVVWDGEIIDQDYYTRDFLQNAVHEVWPALSAHQ